MKEKSYFTHQINWSCTNCFFPLSQWKHGQMCVFHYINIWLKICPTLVLHLSKNKLWSISSALNIVCKDKWKVQTCLSVKSFHALMKRFSLNLLRWFKALVLYTVSCFMFAQYFSFLFLSDSNRLQSFSSDILAYHCHFYKPRQVVITLFLGLNNYRHYWFYLFFEKSHASWPW